MNVLKPHLQTTIETLAGGGLQSAGDRAGHGDRSQDDPRVSEAVFWRSAGNFPTGITNAQCWAHSRRGIFEAKGAEPKPAAHALEQIAALYKVEQEIRERKLTGEAKRQHRLTHSKPLVDQFFKWVDAQFEKLGLLPSNPLTKALAYIRTRRTGLSVFLEDPEVAIDTNHIERALRPIPTGRKNWLFCWTEVGCQRQLKTDPLFVESPK